MQLIVEYPDGGGQQIARKMDDICRALHGL